MSDQRIPISQLSETQTAPDASYIAIDDGSLTKKITVENFNSTSTASAQQYANQAAASAQTVEDNIATSAAQIREATLAAREATQASTAASASATSAYDSAALAQNYSVNAATSAGQAMNAADTVAQGVTESKEHAEDSEAWAVGKRNGSDVPSSDVAYHNNAKYYSDNATTAATSAESDADRAEAAADSINLPDPTLTVSGTAADSKAAGDAVRSLADMLETETVSDVSIAIVDDAAGGLPLKKLTAQIEPTQSGTGDPSPDNVRQISGYTGVTFTRTDGENPSGTIDTFGVTFPTEAGTVYGGTLIVNSDGSGTLTVDKFMRSCDADSSCGKGSSTSIDEFYFRASSSEVGVSGSYYDADHIVCSHAKNITGSSTSEIYTRLNSGQARIVFPLSYGMSDLATFKAWLGTQASGGTPLQFCYMLETPTTYALSAVQVVQMLQGANNIWTDVEGALSIIYYVDAHKNYAELADIRLMTNGVTAETAGDAVREQVSGLESITNQLISNNLAGNEATTPYPVYIPAGTTITVSTSDGSVFPTGGTLRLLLLSADGTQTDYWSLANNATYRTITTSASKADTYYIAWNEQPSVPLMVNFGANADPYVPYVTPITSKVDKLDSAIEGINAWLATLKASWFASEVQAVTVEFVSFYGKKTANNNYKCAKYPVRNGSLKVRVDSIFVYWSSSQYNVFAAYNDSDEFLGGLKNSEVNTTTAGGTFTNVEWDIPKGTSYVLVSFARMSDKTEIPTISEYGYNLPEPNERIFNQNLSSDFKQQFYFHVATSELGDYNSLAFNAKFVTETPVEYYDIYFTGYDQDYSGRTFLTYKTGLTKGINGNEIVIAENFQNTANSIKSKYWNGVVLNLKYAASSLESGRWLRSMPLYAITAEYMLLNDTSLELAYYPSSGHTPVIKEYHAPYNPMYGGRLCAIGDSLTGVYYKSASETWSALIAKWNCMEFDNLGISGNPIAKSESYTGGACMAERVDNLDPEKRYTHIFVMGGANDYNLSIPIGTNTDTEITTFKGAVNHIITKLTEKFPMAKIVFGTTYRRVASYADKPYADAMMEVCKLHSIPCLNNYESSGVQFFDANWMAKFGATNQLGNNHLNAAGDMFVAPRIEHALKYGVN